MSADKIIKVTLTAEDGKEFIVSVTIHPEANKLPTVNIASPKVTVQGNVKYYGYGENAVVVVRED